jgi:hypothetical protein
MIILYACWECLSALALLLHHKSKKKPQKWKAELSWGVRHSALKSQHENFHSCAVCYEAHAPFCTAEKHKFRCRKCDFTPSALICKLDAPCWGDKDRNVPKERHRITWLPIRSLIWPSDMQNNNKEAFQLLPASASAAASESDSSQVAEFTLPSVPRTRRKVRRYAFFSVLVSTNGLLSHNACHCFVCTPLHT